MLYIYLITKLCIEIGTWVKYFAWLDGCPVTLARQGQGNCIVIYVSMTILSGSHVLMVLLVSVF